ncbi:MAG: DUF937 domain-containing protein [Chitinophagaceae bacterium]|nr:DUF937 domain-containing protein [Chitinophagaceae bacterium]
MLDQLINLVKEHAGNAINNNPAIPADKKEEAVNVAGSSVAGGLQDMLSKGGISEVLKMFSGRTDVNDSPVTQHVSSSLTDNLSSKLGIPSAQAGGIAASIIPSILGSLVNKTNDPNDHSFNIQDIFNQFSGGKTSGMDIGGMLNKFKGGLDKDGDGDVDLNDLTSMFGSGGGIMDRVKGMFK